MAASVCAVRATTDEGKHTVRIVGVEPGTEGAATIYVDGKRVPYVLRGRTTADGTQAIALISDGLIYDETNSVVLPGGP